MRIPRPPEFDPANAAVLDQFFCADPLAQEFASEIVGMLINHCVTLHGPVSLPHLPQGQPQNMVLGGASVMQPASVQTDVQMHHARGTMVAGPLASPPTGLQQTPVLRSAAPSSTQSRRSPQEWAEFEGLVSYYSSSERSSGISVKTYNQKRRKFENGDSLTSIRQSFHRRAQKNKSQNDLRAGRRVPSPTKSANATAQRRLREAIMRPSSGSNAAASPKDDGNTTGSDDSLVPTSSQ